MFFDDKNPVVRPIRVGEDMYHWNKHPKCTSDDLKLPEQNQLCFGQTCDIERGIYRLLIAFEKLETQAFLLIDTKKCTRPNWQLALKNIER